MGNFVALSYETLTLAQQGAAAGAQPAKKEEKPAAEEAPVKVPSTKELGELQNDCASLRAAAEVCQANAKKALDKAEEEKEQTQKKDEEAHKKEEKKAEEDRQKKKKDEEETKKKEEEKEEEEKKKKEEEKKEKEAKEKKAQ